MPEVVLYEAAQGVARDPEVRAAGLREIVGAGCCPPGRAMARPYRRPPLSCAPERTPATR